MAPLSVGESERVSCVVVTAHSHCHDGRWFVWFVVSNGLGEPTGMAALLPVDCGVAGGAVCALYSPRQGVAMAAVSGLLWHGFLWFRPCTWLCQ